jgi:hypothetical protein
LRSHRDFSDIGKVPPLPGVFIGVLLSALFFATKAGRQLPVGGITSMMRIMSVPLLLLLPIGKHSDQTHGT